MRFAHLREDRSAAIPPGSARARIASVAEAPVAYVCKSVKAVPAQFWFETSTPRGLPNAIDTVRFLAADALRASARRPDRGLASARQACGGLQRRYLGVVPAPPGNFLCSFFASPVLIFVSAVAFHHDKW